MTEAECRRVFLVLLNASRYITGREGSRGRTGTCVKYVGGISPYDGGSDTTQLQCWLSAAFIK